MADLTRFLNDASAGGDGTTNNLAGATAAFATEAATLSWIGTNPDLVSDDDNFFVNTTGAFGDLDIASLGLTTNATHRVTFRDYGSGTTFSTSGTFTTLISAAGDYVDMDEIGLRFTGASHSRGMFVSAGVLDQCTVHSQATTLSSDPFDAEVTRTTVLLDDTGGHTWTSSSVLTQNTIVAPNVNFIVGAFDTVTHTNTYFNVNAFTTATSRATTLINCGFILASITSDGDDVLTNLVYSVPYSTSTFTNVTGGAEDFHLVSGSGLINVGFDNSGSYTIDIEGTTFSTWDIGAYAFVSVGGVSIPVIMNQLRNQGVA